MLRVLGDRVLVRPRPQPTKSAGGIDLPDYYAPEVRGTVVGLGDGPQAEDGTLLPHRAALGADVLFPAEAGHEVWINRERLIVLREDDLQAVVEQQAS